MGAPVNRNRRGTRTQAPPRSVGVEAVADRLDRAVALVGLEPDEHAALQRILLPEEFGPFDPKNPPAAPTVAPPGTVGKVSAMVARARLRLPLSLYSDAGPPAGPAARPEFVLMYRLEARTREDALREARGVLGRGRATTGRTRANGELQSGGLPSRASVEAV